MSIRYKVNTWTLDTPEARQTPILVWKLKKCKSNIQIADNEWIFLAYNVVQRKIS